MERLSRHEDLVDAVLRMYIDTLRPCFPALALMGIYANKQRIKRDTAILLDDGALLGAVTFADRGRVTSLDYLVVAPEYRGHGVGKQLLAHTEQKTKHPVIMTKVFDTAVCSWYVQRGFEEVKRYSDALYPTIVMKKDLHD